MLARSLVPQDAPLVVVLRDVRDRVVNGDLQTKPATVTLSNTLKYSREETACFSAVGAVRAAIGADVETHAVYEPALCALLVASTPKEALRIPAYKADQQATRADVLRVFNRAIRWAEAPCV